MKLSLIGAALATSAALAGRATPSPAAARISRVARDTVTIDSALFACLDTADASPWPSQPTFVNAILADTLHYDYRPAATAVASAVAALAADAFGGADSLTPGEPMLTWRAVERGVTVTAFRDGRLTWSRDAAVWWDASSRASEWNAGPTLFAQSLQAIVDAHAVPPWPASITDDSVRFRLELGRVMAGPYPREQAVRVTHSPRSPFTLRLPPDHPVALRGRGLTPSYPSGNQAAGFSGTLSVSFVVDASGRAMPTTFKPVGDERVPLMTGDQQQAYREFLESVRRSVLASRYEPASIGGCRVRMVVNQQFVFHL